MTSVLSARRRAEEFAAVVDGGSPSRPELAGLADVVSALRAHEPPAPRPDFAADLRERLLSEAATVLRPVNAGLALPTRTPGRRERRLVAVASAVVLVGGTAGMAAASQNALPGEALYPVKRGIEKAQSGLASSDTSKGRDLLAQADDRLTEVQRLLSTGSPEQAPQIPSTIADFTDQARSGAGLLLGSFGQDQDPATVSTVRTFAARGLTRLQDLARTAPAGAQDDLAAAATALTEIDQQARDACSRCAEGLPALTVPRAFLAAAEVKQALRSLDVSRLDNSHPVVVDRRAVTRHGAGKPGATRSSAPVPKLVRSPSAVASSGVPTPAAPTSTPAPTGITGQVTKGTKELGNTVGSTTQGLSDGLNGLNGVVETLLPDPDQQLP